MRRVEKGFTLIELVIVMVILGILAAVAVPKFTDFSSDAKAAAVAGGKSAVASAIAIATATAKRAPMGSEVVTALPGSACSGAGIISIDGKVNVTTNGVSCSSTDITSISGASYSG